MAGNYHHSTLPASQSAATSHDLGIADTIEDIVAPALRFPFSGTYSSQLEIPEDEEPSVYHSTAILAPAIMESHQGATTAVSTPWTTTQDRNSNFEKKPSYLSITRPWDQQLPIQQRTKPANSGQTQAQLAV